MTHIIADDHQWNEWCLEKYMNVFSSQKEKVAKCLLVTKYNW